MTQSTASSPRRPGVVSIVVLNYRTPDDTIACLESLSELDWPADRLEVICIDNDSGDGSAEAIRAAAAAHISVIESAANSGFAGGCNLGARAATGEYVAFINADARPHAQWIRAAIDALSAERDIACVASKVLDWDGRRVDYVGGGLTFYGMGYKREAGQIDSVEYDVAKDVLFPTGSAMVIRAASFEAAGGFDERFFMFYEDVDLGWRLNLMGQRVRYVPDSLVYHRHHGSISKFGSYRERYLLERNALLTIFKNFEQQTLDVVLAPALLLAARRAASLGGDDISVLDLQRNGHGDESDTMDVDKQSIAGLYAIAYLATNMAELSAERASVQATRVHSDRALLRLFEEPIEAAIDEPAYLGAFNAIVEQFRLRETFSPRRRILVITNDVLADRMAGPGIRAFEIARALAPEHDVTLVSTSTCTLASDDFDCLEIKPRALRPIVEWAEIIIFQGFVLRFSPWIADSGKILVVDIYDPMHLEQLEQTKDLDDLERTARIADTTQVLNAQLTRGDFFLCASNEQRMFWLGQMAGLGRINPANYARDDSLQSLIAVCPFGLPQTPATRVRAAIKGVVPGIGPDDKVILWAGGVYNWFDPVTLIHAVDRLRRTHPDVRLFFLGMKHPNPNVPSMRTAFEARQASDQLGLTGTHVFFNDAWVDYEDRQNYLLDADVGVSTHFEHVETTFSFRTRILDYLWAGLPIVATRGDTFGSLIESRGLGRTVPDQNVDALVEALEEALYDEAAATLFRSNVQAVRGSYTWPNALKPLLEFCRQADVAADRADESFQRTSKVVPRPEGNPIARNVRYARERFGEGGARLVAGRALAKAKRIVGS